MAPFQKRPRQGGAHGEIAKLTPRYAPLTAHAPHLPADWRNRLPSPLDYYKAHVAKLSKPNGSGWAQGRCPFHDDHDASLSVNLDEPRGGWRCFAGCGAGDLVGFQMLLTGKPFKDAVAELLTGRTR